MSAEPVSVLGVPGLGEIAEGASVGRLLAEALEREGSRLASGDVVAISHKIVSKAEGRVRDLGTVEPGERARGLARILGKDPRVVELALSESRAVLRAERGILITETRHGLVCANAGLDASNVPGAETVALLPDDPDSSARRIRGELREACGGVELGVVISDSFGRAWRLGQAEVAIGCAGVVALDDWRGRSDRQGRELTATAVAAADHLAAAADLVRTKDSGMPAAVIRGMSRLVTAEDGPGAAALRRPPEEDLFR